MGNKQSSSLSSTGGSRSNSRSNNIEYFDEVVCRYILEMRISNLRQMYDTNYCDKLTSIIVQITTHYFSDTEIRQIHDRVNRGKTSKILEEEEEEEEEEEVDMKEADKNQCCIDIAKFYVKIAHLFATILLTINPEIKYTHNNRVDNNGDDKIFVSPFGEKDDIPHDAFIERIHTGLCKKQTDVLGELTHNMMMGGGGGGGSSNEKSRENSRIMELEELYYDDDYDIETGEFKGMSGPTREEFHDDLRRFYKLFTQHEDDNENNEKPDAIRRFSDIKLTDHGKHTACFYKSRCSNEPVVQQGQDKYNDLISEYAHVLRNMLYTVNKKHSELVAILKSVLLIPLDNTETDSICIQPELTIEMLDGFIATSRILIIDLYLNCESDYVEGLQIYEAVVELLVLKSVNRQIDTLNRERVRLIHGG